LEKLAVNKTKIFLDRKQKQRYSKFITRKQKDKNKMAHEIENMMYVGETPWHGLGKAMIQPPKDVQEALEMGGLDWNVNSVPLFAHLSEGLHVQAPSNAIVRDSDNSILGVVGPNYQPVNNAEAFRFFDPAIENGFVDIETAGSLRAGKRVWMLAKIRDSTHDVVFGDPVSAYFLISNSHDGTLAVRVGFTSIRVVCQNTLSLAHHEGKGKLIQVRHTKNVKTALDKMQEIVDWQRNTFAATVDQFKFLASVGCNELTLRKYVETVFEKDMETDSSDSEVEGEEENKSLDKLMDKIYPLFTDGKGNSNPKVSGTLWAAYNAVTEYQTWNRGRSTDNRLNSLWFGLNKKTNERAFDVAMSMAA
jgi:phage/plasmid-like protein (TIGR03299 family)